jgi:LPXTG-site transpeptidase (sortase) family protein
MDKIKIAIRIVALFLIFAGMAVVVYPHALQYQYDKTEEAAYKVFVNKTEEAAVTPEKAAAATVESSVADDVSKSAAFPNEELYREMEAYNKKIFDEGQSELSDPWSFEQASFHLEEYGFDEEVIGYINIPRIDLVLPIYLGASEENMRKGAAQLSQTSLPIGGDNTNCVICGHRGYYAAKMFRDLVNLEHGDEITVTNLWYTMTYRVTSTTTILDSDINQLKIQSGRDMLTLFTCFYQQNRKDRFVVFCDRVS